MKLPPPGLQHPIPDPSERTLTGQEYEDRHGEPYRGIPGVIYGVRIIEDKDE